MFWHMQTPYGMRYNHTHLIVATEKRYISTYLNQPAQAELHLEEKSKAGQEICRFLGLLIVEMYDKGQTLRIKLTDMF